MSHREEAAGLPASLPSARLPETPGVLRERHLCVVLHDVAPARWDGCARVLRQLRRVAAQVGVAAVPVTLLVVPQLHGDTALPPHYLRWLRRLARAGHELALHGLTHRDESPPAATVAERLLRRHYTAGEGEFAVIDDEGAASRIAQGQAWARANGLTMRGFVAPAWLLSAAAARAVTAAGFEYTCTLSRLIALPGAESLHAQSLVFSTRSAWRRALSLVWNTALGWHSRQAPLLRLELHPADADHPAVMRCWSRLLADALSDRQPLRLGQAADRVRDAGTRPAAAPR